MTNERLKEAVHVVVAASNPARLGAIRLRKALWFADWDEFRKSGRTITGEKYVKLPKGPVPKAIDKAIEELESEKMIAVGKRQVYSYAMTQYMSLETPHPHALSQDEVDKLEAYASVLCENYTADEVSDITHGLAWKVASIGSEIPMAAVLVENSGQVTEEVIAWANSRLKGSEQRANA